ncbi:MAG: ArnT family glycosyltransferase, partial [Anaerolineae bacterium]
QLTARYLEGLTPPVPEDLAQYAGLSDRVKRGAAWFITGRQGWPGAFSDYGHVYLVGRRVVGIMDTLALVALFALGARLYDRRVGLLAATLGAFTAFHIQQSHFFTADAPANFFVVLALVGLAGVAQGRWGAYPILAGVATGMALGSKISVWPLVPLAVVAAVMGYGPAARDVLGGRRRSWLLAATGVMVLGLSTYVAVRVAQPDMWVGPGWPNVVENGDRFAEVTAGAPSWWFALRRVVPDVAEPWLLPDPRWASNMAQIRGQISGHGMDWPPNHQWWGRRAYIFPWKNMVLWGMGLPLGLTAWAAWGAAGVALFRGRRRHLIPFLWVAMNFAYLGVQWAKTMRYYLPMYPALTVLAAWGLVAWWDRARHADRTQGEDATGGHAWQGRAWLRRRMALPPVAQGARDLTTAMRRGLARMPWRPAPSVVPSLALAAVVGATALWGVMVSRIYVREHSRIAGSRWIYHNVPAGASLRVSGGPWPYLPVENSLSLTMAGHTYTVADDEALEAARVYVPGGEAVTVDGLVLSNLSDPAADPEAEAVRVEVVDNRYPTEANVLSSGTAEAPLAGDAEQDVFVALPEVTLEAGGEYYVRLTFTGAPVQGRLPILALETRWDDAIPVGLDGYAPYDDASTSWA